MRYLGEQSWSSNAEVEAFDTLLPHVAELAEQGDVAKLSHALPAFETLSASMDKEDNGWRRAEVIPFLLGRDGRVARMTAAAAEGLNLVPGDDFSVLLNAAGRAVFSDLLVEKSAERLVSAPILPGGRPALVGLTPSRKGISARALVSFWRPELSQGLQSVFDLSEAETDVARCLFEGLRPKAIAELRGRSVETVRAQVKAIFRKTSARSVLDFTHLVYGLNAHPSVGAPGSSLGTIGEARVWQGPDGPIDVYCDGTRTGKPLVFIHGCLGGRTFVEYARNRLQSRFIIALGRPGHGRTPVGEGTRSRTPEVAAKQLISVLNALGVQRVDIVAHDIGAATALKAAQVAPQRIDKVLIVGGLPPMPRATDLLSLPRQQRVFPLLSRISSTAGYALAKMGGERLLVGGPDSFGGIVFAGSPVDMAACRLPDVAEHYWRGHGWHTLQGPVGFVGDASIAATAWHEDIVPSDVPVTFIHGNADASASLRAIDTLVQRTEGQLVPVRGGGHTLIHARPDVWTEYLDD